ncbi:hypothetical protein AQI88_18345 [Streptomyces cellostaticus]|uniref:Uncharacterized protein n=1 Tax=Streptomyces cellostaticus TaxID=67285 RepID=A0A124HCQ7_9ACTN|nr:hypothetical protein [Streptomyces cellostaticus]KUM95166.1 hypothetical protein AQI88_18345 [Streptomyces cellostaticus]GHI02148.1 hypothetical protein Scel_04690 [Streptomyces cellostaticus]
MNTVNTVKPTQSTQTPAAAKPAAPEMNFASKSVPRHLARGVIGFGLIIGSIALVPVVGPVSLLAAPLGLIAFRGCPTCWMVGLAQTISRGRLERKCVDGVCTIAKADPAKKAADDSTVDTTAPADSR